jgi:hypothetical protein
MIAFYFENPLAFRNAGVVAVNFKGNFNGLAPGVEQQLQQKRR